MGHAISIGREAHVATFVFAASEEGALGSCWPTFGVRSEGSGPSASVSRTRIELPAAWDEILAGLAVLVTGHCMPVHAWHHIIPCIAHHPQLIFHMHHASSQPHIFYLISSESVTHLLYDPS
jgi:hypothetical protein